MSSTPFLDKIAIRGGGMTRQMRTAVLSAKLDGSMSEVNQLDLTFADNGFNILRSGLLTLKAGVDIDDFSLEIAAITTGEQDGYETVTIKARPRIVRRLKDRRGAKVMKKVSPSEFVISECRAVGARYHVQGSADRKTVARDVPKKGSQEVDNPPSSWTTFKRLADELGYVLFETGGVIHFGRPSWLISNASDDNTVIARHRGAINDDRMVTIPVATRSLDSPSQSISGSLRVNSPRHIRSGMRLELSGVPTFDDKYLVSSFSIDLLDPKLIADFTAATALNPNPGGDGGQEPRRGTRLASDFAYWVQKQVGDKYSRTVEVNTGAFSVGTFNGEELVEWAASQIGAFMPDGANNQIEYCEAHGTLTDVNTALKKRGALLWRNNFMAVSLGNHTVVEPVNGRIGVRKKAKTSQYKRAGYVPGVKYW
jgi:hypothetical protein